MFFSLNNGYYYLRSIFHMGAINYQDIALLYTEPFGKVNIHSTLMHIIVYIIFSLCIISLLSVPTGVDNMHNIADSLKIVALKFW